MKTILIALLFPLSLMAADFTPTPVKIDTLIITNSNIPKVISYQSPVKSQKKRGTCTIFSTIGLLEALMVKHNKMDRPDLSEEYLEYIIMTRQFDEGSTVNRNIKKLRFFGLPKEESWPYLGVRWRTLQDSELSLDRCSHLEDKLDDKEDDTYPETQLSSCLLGHRDPNLLRAPDDFVLKRDPEFYEIRQEAREIKKNVFDHWIVKKDNYKLTKLSEVKNLLLQNTPLILGMKLYYGSWNHSKTEKFDIQKRDKSRWYQGIVGYPEMGSRDRRISGEKGGGHSVVIVGFDDNKIVKQKMLMEDGTWKEFTYKGVYYFKNSWGVRGSGRDFQLEGKSYPGYGMITQKYAHELGTFYHLPVKSN